MFKIMLVDDSPIELSGLKDLVQWDALDLQVVATATNGRQAPDPDRAADAGHPDH